MKENFIKLIFWFSLACLTLSIVSWIFDLVTHRTFYNPMNFVFLFVGLLGAYIAPVLKSQQKRLDLLESQIRSIENNDKDKA